MTTQQRGFEMPAVRPGQIVTWFPTGAKSNDGLPAVVTQVNPRSVCLSVFSRSTYNLLIRDGVRHVKDPGARQLELDEAGAWDHTEETRLLENLHEQVVILQEQVMTLLREVDVVKGAVAGPAPVG